MRPPFLELVFKTKTTHLMVEIAANMCTAIPILDDKRNIHSNLIISYALKKVSHLYDHTIIEIVNDNNIKEIDIAKIIKY